MAMETGETSWKWDAYAMDFCIAGSSLKALTVLFVFIEIVLCNTHIPA